MRNGNRGQHLIRESWFGWLENGRISPMNIWITISKGRLQNVTEGQQRKLATINRQSWTKPAHQLCIAWDFCYGSSESKLSGASVNKDLTRRLATKWALDLRVGISQGQRSTSCDHAGMQTATSVAIGKVTFNGAVSKTQATVESNNEAGRSDLRSEAYFKLHCACCRPDCLEVYSCPFV
jgi:hypothetical protein